MDIYELNKSAWDRAVTQGDNPFTQVASPEAVAEARAGTWSLFLSDLKPVPRDWFGDLEGLEVLCLASGGGQQGPILAAVGAHVTVLDASGLQLEQDRFVAERDGLEIRLVQGDMADLCAFEDGRFDLIVNPPSTLFVSDLSAVWRECHRVTRAGGVLMTGFMNPDEFVFDSDALDNEGKFVVKHALPFVEHETLDSATLEDYRRTGRMLHFSHTMEAQLGGLMRAGFVLTDFYEDRRSEADGNPIRHFMPTTFVARAQKIDVKLNR
jgi:SAM-dependent methyltransferase